jgi:hypothetical protein
MFQSNKQELIVAAVAGGLATGLALHLFNGAAKEDRQEGSEDAQNMKFDELASQKKPVLERLASAPGKMESTKSEPVGSKPMAWERSHIARMRRASDALSPRDAKAGEQLQAYLAGFTSNDNQKRCMKKLFRQSVRRVQTLNLVRRMRKTSVQETGIIKPVTPCRAASLPEEHIDKLVRLTNQFGWWEFNIWELRALTKTPLACVGYELICARLKLHTTFGINQNVLLAFLRAVESNYNPNPYHNALHGADAALALYYMLTTGKMQEVAKLSDLQVLAGLVAGLCHDLGHEGVNNQVCVESRLLCYQNVHLQSICTVRYGVASLCPLIR